MSNMYEIARLNRTMDSISHQQGDFTPNPLKNWMKKDGGINRFYVYILKLNCGRFYIGHTRELIERITEHKEGQTISTAGENPKLRYFEMLPTREEAIAREHELKRLVKHNQREIYRMIWNFHDLISEIDIS
jgi:putative endonuclease